MPHHSHGKVTLEWHRTPSKRNAYSKLAYNMSEPAACVTHPCSINVTQYKVVATIEGVEGVERLVGHDNRFPTLVPSRSRDRKLSNLLSQYNGVQPTF